MGFFESQHIEPNTIEATKRRLRTEGRSWVDLASGNPTKHGIFFPQSVLKRAFAKAVRGGLYEPDCQGLPAAREAISQLYRGQVAGEGLFLTASTSESYRLLLSLLCEPGSSVLVPDVSYPLFEFFAADTRTTLIPYRLDPENHWRVDPKTVKARPNTRAAIIVSPNNPTGSIVRDFSPFEALKVPLIIDEVFADFTAGAPVHLQGGHLTVPVFTLNGLSKMFALPGLKLGWIALNQMASEIFGERLGFLNDTYLSASYLVQGMVPTIMAEGVNFRSRFIRSITRNQESACTVLCSGNTIVPLPREGGASLVCQVKRGIDEDVVAVRLLERGFEVYPGYFFGIETPGHFVVSLVAPEQDLRRGLVELMRVVNETE